MCVCTQRKVSAVRLRGGPSFLQAGRAGEMGRDILTDADHACKEKGAGQDVCPVVCPVESFVCDGEAIAPCVSDRSNAANKGMFVSKIPLLVLMCILKVHTESGDSKSGHWLDTCRD